MQSYLDRTAAHRGGRAGRIWASMIVLASVIALLVTPAALAQDESPSPQSASPLERVQAYVQPAVVYQEITWTGWVWDKFNKLYFNDGNPFTVTFQCTGFIVNPNGHIATAGHCVEYDDTVKSSIVQAGIDWAYDTSYYANPLTKEEIANEVGNWRIDGKNKKNTADIEVSVAYGVSASGEPSGKALPALVQGFQGFEEGDVALLKIDAEDLTAVKISESDDHGVGTEVVSVGYPASVDLVTDNTFDPSFKEGTISAEKTVSGGLLPVYEISAAVSGGMSGGPTTIMNGDVIGVNSFGISGETQPFNFVQPSSTLLGLLQSEGVTNELGEVTELYRAGLDAFFAGDRTTAISSFDAVLDIVPNHQFAQQYRREAQRLPEPEPESSGMPIGLIIGIVVAVLVIGGVVVVLMRAKGKGTAAPAGAAAAPAAPVVPAAPPAPAPVATEAAPAPEVPAAAPPAAEEPTAPIEPQAPAEPAEPVASSAESAPSGGFCPKCGTPYDVDARFCQKCGQDLQA